MLHPVSGAQDEFLALADLFTVRIRSFYSMSVSHRFTTHGSKSPALANLQTLSVDHSLR